MKCGQVERMRGRIREEERGRQRETEEERSGTHTCAHYVCAGLRVLKVWCGRSAFSFSLTACICLLFSFSCSLAPLISLSLSISLLPLFLIREGTRLRSCRRL